MKTHTVGIVMNGVTGRMGTNQHLVRSLLALRDEGGVPAGEGVRIVPEPVLAGRNADKLAALAEAHGGLAWSTDLDGLLKDPQYAVYFDAQTTQQRYASVLKAIQAGKHVYCEKPSAGTSDEAMGLYHAAQAAMVKHGVVQDKLWLPGLLKLKHLLDTGYFGEVLSTKGDFGYWVFTGEDQPCQRPSWNYRAEDGGGIIVDMLCHWRYVIDNLFGNVTGVTCLGATHVPRRIDERGKTYKCTADDAAYAVFTTDRGVVCQFNSSWCTRVRRDDLLTIQVDGTRGSAVAGLRECWTQHDANTPRPVWNPDVAGTIDYRAGWTRMPDNREYDNAFKAQWALFLKHVVLDAPFPWDLRAGARGVQLAELGIASWQQRKTLDVPEL